MKSHGVFPLCRFAVSSCGYEHGESYYSNIKYSKIICIDRTVKKRENGRSRVRGVIHFRWDFWARIRKKIYRLKVIWGKSSIFAPGTNKRIT